MLVNPSRFNKYDLCYYLAVVAEVYMRIVLDKLLHDEEHSLSPQQSSLFLSLSLSISLSFLYISLSLLQPPLLNTFVTVYL